MVQLVKNVAEAGGAEARVLVQVLWKHINTTPRHFMNRKKYIYINESDCKCQP